MLFIRLISLQIKNFLQRLIDFSHRFSIQLASNFDKPVAVIDSAGLQAIGYGFF